ncbi:hypothetical protein EPI10_031444 [Gossypium australe]|uniref:Uncharacterized protein n=1 Tax=Gossypium australe TaxID=47621 RepID=A0A5B6X0C2_9ROSI|nr:hypothetical protein EPI10_031444 [Gossypium australe]
MQDGRIIQISLRVVKEIKGHNRLWVFSNLTSNRRKRPQGSLPRNTETNPSEQIHAIIVRNVEGLVKPKKKSKLEAIVKSDEIDEATLKRDHTNEQNGKFLELLKKLHINLPFVKAFS